MSSNFAGRSAFSRTGATGARFRIASKIRAEVSPRKGNVPVEQQRNLLKSAPSDYDMAAAVKIMREEMRHGTQMSYLLVKYFGSSGKLEAQKLLERRAFNNGRLLGAFNQDVQSWLDFYCYT